MKKILFAVFALLVSASTEAQTFTTFSIQQTDGSVVVLPAVGTKITFSATSLSAAHATQNTTIQLSGVDFMCFGDADEALSGFEHFSPNEIGFFSHQGNLQLTAPAGLFVQLFDLTGRLLTQQMSTGTPQNIATQLSQGVYVVRVGRETLKTIVR